ncbi:MAG: hypothetical protein LDL44_00400 [Caenispirillum sp.]|nr:hypothetical protein [Caenispirillum sp.]
MTRQLLRADRARLLALLGEPEDRRQWLALHPSWQAVWLYRWSHYQFVHGRRLLARLLWHVNLLLTGADISPLADFGPGLVIRCPLCVVLLGKAGANLTVHGHGGIGGGLSSEDIGAGPGLPVLGDDVTLQMRALILGPVRIGSGTCIGPGCVVTRDTLPGTVIEAVEPRLSRNKREKYDDAGTQV